MTATQYRVVIDQSATTRAFEVYLDNQMLFTSDSFSAADRFAEALAFAHNTKVRNKVSEGT